MGKIQSKETGLSTIPLLFIVLEALAGLKKKENWRDQHKKSRNQTISLSRWHDIIHEKFQKLPVLITYIINKFTNAAGYRINLKKINNSPMYQQQTYK